MKPLTARSDNKDVFTQARISIEKAKVKRVGDETRDDEVLQVLNMPRQDPVQLSVNIRRPKRREAKSAAGVQSWLRFIRLLLAVELNALEQEESIED